MHIFQLKSNDMLYKIEPAWILLLKHIITYYGVLPPNVKTTLTLNADGTYRLKQKSANDSDSCEVLNEIFKVLDDNNVLMLIHPSSGDNIFYMIKSNNCNILMDSFGNEPPKEKVKYYVLKRD